MCKRYVQEHDKLNLIIEELWARQKHC
jgi:hypothetical protein